jgi:hypothetical protein
MINPFERTTSARSFPVVSGGKERWTLDELVKAAFDTKVHQADQLITRWCRSGRTEPKRAERARKLKRGNQTSCNSGTAQHGGFNGDDLCFPLLARRLRPLPGSDTNFITDRTPPVRIRALEDVLDELNRKFRHLARRLGRDSTALQRPLANRSDFSDARPSLPVAGGTPSHGGIFFAF